MKGTKKGNTWANNNAKGSSKITSKVAKRGKAAVAAQSPRSPKVNKEQRKTVKEKPPVKRRIILSKQTKELNDGNNNALPSCSSANETNVFIAEQESENGVPSSKGNETKPTNFENQVIQASNLLEDDHIKLSVDANEEDEFQDFEGEVVEMPAKFRRMSNPTEIVGNTPQLQHGVPAQQLFMQSPELQQMFQSMIKEGVKSALEQQSQQGNNSLRETAVTQPKTGMEKPKDFAMKSPSDTTIYVPALRLNNPANLIMQPTNSIPVNSDVNNIANFVENIRLQVESQEANNIDSILDVAKEAPRQQILGEPGQSSQTPRRPPVEKADPIR